MGRDGQQVAEGRIERTTPFLFSADETTDVGVDEATPVTEDYAERHNESTGTIGRMAPAGVRLQGETRG